MRIPKLNTILDILATKATTAELAAVQSALEEDIDQQSNPSESEEILGDKEYTGENDFTGGTLLLPNDTPVNAIAATLTTTLTGDNNDLVFTSNIKGIVGNNIAISYINPETDTAACSVSVSGLGTESEPYLIDVTLSYGEAAITATANDIITVIEGDTSADLLVSVALSGEDTGEGLVTAMASTSLDNGVDGTPGKANQVMSDGRKIYVCSIEDLTTENDNWLSTTLT